MAKEEEELNLYEKLAKIRKQVEVIKKNKTGYGYKYVTDDEILAKITGLMDKYSVSLIPQIVPNTMHHEQYHYLKTRYNKATESYYDEHNNEIIVSADMEFLWINNKNPEERVVVPWTMIGQQSDASQSFGSGLTYAFRYFLLKYFNVATPDDDPDKWRAKQKEAEDAEDKVIIDASIEEIDKIVKEYLAEHTSEEESVAIKNFIGKYVNKANYFNIDKVSTAVQLLNDIKVWTFKGKGNK